MDILSSLRNVEAIGEDGPTQGRALNASFRPQTISEIIDSQISYHESKIADLKAAKAAISPEVEKALNALAKLS